MTMLVQLVQPAEAGSAAGPPIYINPEHVVLVEPIAARGMALTRVWVAAPVGPERAWHRDVVGTAPEIAKKLGLGGGAAADPLGTIQRRAS